ncbi:hypothetical protein OAN307_c00960 [Octadecabacter antarcticus 307]|uniref:Uncharacterized protein n=1 Tax=Octadecabacter antarcticus 307 TaxID=391626 RepID=M9QZR6_9RHOB|nr:hypothetical protein OAN307_c00960 [Octadecabacter antarcticus 307]
MLTSLTSLAVAGGAIRLALNWQLRKRWAISLAVPQALALALIGLALLLDFLKPVKRTAIMGHRNGCDIAQL